MPNSSAGGILKRTLRHSKYSGVSTYTVFESRALPWSFTFFFLGYKLKSLKIGDGPETRQSSTCCRDFETKERKSEGRERGRTRHAVQTISKRQALYSGKVPEERETRNSDTAL